MLSAFFNQLRVQVKNSTVGQRPSSTMNERREELGSAIITTCSTRNTFSSSSSSRSINTAFDDFIQKDLITSSWN
ncbi:hypothetical protein INT45_011382 [Circinella minor]|uniref:Uncharacterized protein n=1 Tax=Circinella minor TaxID=1195481 RepID=A0A8H7VSR6_9FUNG|nr:hypothetical protein INT45_011382 [Circinella minor]